MSLPTVPASITGPFNVHASVTCKPGTADKFTQAAKVTQELSLKEEGVLAYSFSRVPNEDKFWVYEQYASKEAFDNHVKGEAFTSLGQTGLVTELELAFTKNL